MAFNSSTKSWKACNDDQQRECKAHALFSKLGTLDGEVKAFVRWVKQKLRDRLVNIRIKQENKINLEEKEKGLLVLEDVLKSLTEDSNGLTLIEGNFTLLQSFSIIEPIGNLHQGMVDFLITSRNLSKLAKATGKFKWSGGAQKVPKGKSQSEVGISDDILNKLLKETGADATLTSWLQSGDDAWKKSAEGEIDTRKKELAALKKNDPESSQIGRLEFEIKKLEKDWTL